MKKASCFLLVLLFFTLNSLWAQDLPHVTDISVEARNNLIRLTWTDAPDARGPVYIFRSARPFGTTIPANIRPVVVRYGTQYYIDDTDNIENIYYFIAASDTAGKRFDIIIPQMNSTNVNLAQSDETTAEDSDSDEPQITAITIPEPEPIEGLSNIKAVLQGDKVTITFNNTEPKRNTILYRSTQPIRRPQDLLHAVIVQPAADTIFEDYPVPGLSWYYALFYEDELSKGDIVINPGINTTLTAVTVMQEQTAGSAMRPRPLPELSLNERRSIFFTNQTGEEPLSMETIDMLSSTNLPQKESLTLRKPRVFKIDLQAPAGGEDSALFKIVNDYFKKFDWMNSYVNLEHFLSLPRSREVEARARFYLGQSLYFTGNYREALIQFLSFRGYHEVEASIWIDATLKAMVH